MRHLSHTDIHAGRGIRYEALSENSGVLVTEGDEALFMTHDPDTDIVDFMICEAGDRPTFMNKAAALSMREKWYDAWLDSVPFKIPHPANIMTKEKPAPYTYRDKGQEALTPEYQLYLAKQLEGKQKASKPTFAETVELSGYLPHEESPQ